MPTLYDYLCYFVIYAILGWCLEVVFAALNTGKFVNRGFLNGPYCPIYGAGVVVVVFCLTPIADNFILLFIGSVILTSLVELVTGFVLEKAFGTRWWDYSQEPFNIGGYVCLKFSLAWGLACLMVVDMVQPLIASFVDWVHSPVAYVILSGAVAGILTDAVITIVSVRKLTHRLEEMDELAARMRSTSDALGKLLSENAIELKEKVEEAKEKVEEAKGRIEEARERTAEAREAKEAEKYRELWEKYQSMVDAHMRIHDRLMSAFPKSNSKKHHESLEALRDAWERRKEAEKARKKAK